MPAARQGRGLDVAQRVRRQWTEAATGASEPAADWSSCDVSAALRVFRARKEGAIGRKVRTLHP
eukprot:7155295-Lingulodinium_polyedra.AAC.1